MDYLYITENQYQDLLSKWDQGKTSGIENDPLAYIMVTNEGFIAIDNSSGEFFTEEFTTEIEAKFYLGVKENFSKDNLIETVKNKVTNEYQLFEKRLLNNLSKEEIIHSASEIVTKNEVKYLLINDDYLDSLDSSLLTNMLDYTASPLDDVWKRSLKFSELDLSTEIIDHMLMTLYEESPSLNERLDGYIEKNSNLNRNTLREKETERWKN